MTSNSTNPRRHRPAPVTWSEHEAEARRILPLIHRNLFGNADDILRQAARHLEAARILKALEDLHE